MRLFPFFYSQIFKKKMCLRRVFFPPLFGLFFLPKCFGQDVKLGCRARGRVPFLVYLTLYACISTQEKCCMFLKWDYPDLSKRWRENVSPSSRLHPLWLNEWLAGSQSPGALPHAGGQVHCFNWNDWFCGWLEQTLKAFADVLAWLQEHIYVNVFSYRGKFWT